MDKSYHSSSIKKYYTRVNGSKATYVESVRNGTSVPQGGREEEGGRSPNISRSVLFRPHSHRREEATKKGMVREGRAMERIPTTRQKRSGKALYHGTMVPFVFEPHGEKWERSVRGDLHLFKIKHACM